MRKVTLSIPVVALALCLGTAQLRAQEPGNSMFQWYVGGHGGVLNFQTPNSGRENLPLGGAHLLVTAKRTGLLLSLEQAFGSDEPSSYTLQMFDPTGVLVDQQTVPVTFNYIRKYSATLLAFPVRGPLTPFFGLGVGILHTGGHAPDDEATRQIGSTGFGSLVGGLNFKVSHFSAFGQYQVTTAPRTQGIMESDADGNTFVASGNLVSGPSHTFSAGLRFNLGNAREGSAGGY